MIYEFINDKTGEKVEIVQDINDEHTYEANGEKWRRVFNSQIVPTGLKVDPFSSKQFVEKTCGAGTIGDLIDRSAEMSAMRAEQNGGIDPKRVAAEEKYSKERHGQKAPKNIKEVAALL